MRNTTKIAIPEWKEQVSTVFDFARKLLLIDIDGQKQVNRSEMALTDEPMPQRVARLKNLGVDVLICGAISRPAAFMVMGARIDIIPYVSGPVDEVLHAFMNGQLSGSQFLLPGCRRGARRGFGKGGRGCRWRGGRR